MSSSDTIIQKIDFAPGINKNTTELDAEGVYVCCDKIRFFYGKPEKIGGWEREQVLGNIQGVARDVHTWVDLSEKKLLGLGTHQKLHVFSDGAMGDVTPVVASVSASNVVNTNAGDTKVTISVNPQGAQVGDFFVFAEVTASTGGIDFTSTYPITSVDSGFFTFEASTTAATTCASKGGTAVVDFLLPNGFQSNGATFGWGAGTWNTPGVSASAGWSEPRGGTGIDVNLRQWSLDNWGEDLLANVESGKIYYWEASAGSEQRAVLMSSAAPSIVNTMLVAQEGRHVIALGTHTISGDFDPLLIRWSDSENFSKWEAAATNQAGEFRLENGSFIIGAQESRREVIVFTDESVYSMRRTGGNSVFSFTDLGRHNGLASKHAAVDVNGKVFWMGFNTFHRYDGSIQTLPCTLQKFLFDPSSTGSINLDQKEKIYADTNREFNEIWWFYPSRDSDEIDRYIVYNYLEDTWYNGTLERTVWADVDIFDRPYAVDADGNLYIHEQGLNDDAAGLKATLYTSFFDIADGDELMFIDRYIPDNNLIKDMNIQFNYKKYPQATEELTKGPFNITNTTRKIHPRVRGRQTQMVYSASTQGGDFRIGTDRIAIKPDGKR